jgi:hypothetical protein
MLLQVTGRERRSEHYDIMDNQEEDPRTASLICIALRTHDFETFRFYTPARQHIPPTDFYTLSGAIVELTFIAKSHTVARHIDLSLSSLNVLKYFDPPSALA